MANGELTCVFWDVQHGSAAYINTPANEHLVIDLGVGSYKEANLQFSPLLHLKRRYGVQRLDGVVITHPHRDHLDDIGNFGELSPRVLVRPKHLSEADVLGSNRSQDSPIIRQYLDISATYDQPVSPGENPFRPARPGGCMITYFAPSSCPRSNLNNHSIVTVVTHVGCKLLLPGDNEPPSWEELLAKPDFVEAIRGTDILLAPHHGRDSGFCPALFDHISPRLTVISDGRFGDTSATGRYAAVTQGWRVNRRDGTSQERKCLTTRRDGVIVVRCYSRQNRTYLDVTID
jgi:beta-lactamase superfamily II metal-dependent hydrolase